MDTGTVEVNNSFRRFRFRRLTEPFPSLILVFHKTHTRRRTKNEPSAGIHTNLREQHRALYGPVFRRLAGSTRSGLNTP